MSNSYDYLTRWIREEWTDVSSDVIFNTAYMLSPRDKENEPVYMSLSNLKMCNGSNKQEKLETQKKIMQSKLGRHSSNITKFVNHTYDNIFNISTLLENEIFLEYLPPKVDDPHCGIKGTYNHPKEVFIAETLLRTKDEVIDVFSI